MIQIICGVPGVGKTAFMTANIIQEDMYPAKAREALNACRFETARHQEGGFSNLTVPPYHLAYCNYHVDTKGVRGMPLRSSYELDTSKFSLPHEGAETDLFPFYASINIDESQNDLNSRNSQSFSEYKSRLYEWHRHMGYKIRLIAQRSKLIDANVRELAPEIIQILEMRHKFRKSKLGRNILVKTTWECRKYDNFAEFDEFIRTGKLGGKHFEYTFEGNIFMCYDSEQFKAKFFEGMEERNFTQVTSERTFADVSSYQYFNEHHKIRAGERPTENDRLKKLIKELMKNGEVQNDKGNN